MKFIKITKENIPEVMLIPLFFFIPIEVAPANIIAIVAIALWLFFKANKNILLDSIHHPLTLPFVGFFLIQALSLLWTEDLSHGIEQLSRSLYFIFFPLLIIIISPTYIIHYISAFIFGVSISVFISYGMWFGLVNFENGNHKHGSKCKELG